MTILSPTQNYSFVLHPDFFFLKTDEKVAMELGQIWAVF